MMSVIANDEVPMTIITNPMTIAFFLPIFSKKLLIKNDTIKPATSTQLIRKPTNVVEIDG
jgi:hypothetical protein